MKTKILLIIIIILAATLRLYKITEIPALNADEAAIGYNAYSLLQTGMDEHGNSWPLVFQSFGDYKPGVYFYMVIPFIKFLGLTILAVRLPAVILSIASVYALYLLARELTVNKAVPNFPISQFPLISALLLAISPWHIHFSRGGWETQVSTFFLLTGTYFFLKAIQKQPYYLLFTIFYALSIYSYHSMRVIAPLFGLSLILIYKPLYFLSSSRTRGSMRGKTSITPPSLQNSEIHPTMDSRLLGNDNVVKWQIASLIMGILLLIPFIRSLTSESGLARAQGVSIFVDPGPLNRVNQLRGEHSDFNSLSAKLIHNKFISYTLAIGENYLEHFSGNFLFLSGDDIQRNKIPDFGQLYIVTAPFLLIGIIYLLSNISSPMSQLILSWTLIAPLAAALTFQSPHALRAFNMVIPLTLITATGLSISLNWLKNHLTFKPMLITTYTILLIIFLWDFTRYLHQYYKHLIPTYPFSSQYGFQELVPWVESQKSDYDHIFITDRYDQPYILFLFYSQYPPEQFQSQVILTPRDKFGFSTVRQYDSYRFEAIDYQTIRNDYPNSLIIGTDEEIPSDVPILKEIKLPNSDQVIFQIAHT